MTLLLKDKAWLAGIIDGEGCIMLSNPPSYGSGIHACRVNVVNTDEGILSEVERILNGWVVPHTKRMKTNHNPNRKQCYCIEVNRKLATRKLLKIILPYLKSEKQNKAIKAIEHINSNLRRKNGDRNNLMGRKCVSPL